MTRRNSQSRPALRDRIAAWDAIVAQVEAGYTLDLDDWLNDMDLRRGIGEAIEALTPGQRSQNVMLVNKLKAVDERFRRATDETVKCLWGSKAATREGWRADRHWWYFRRPKSGNERLDLDIETVS